MVVVEEVTDLLEVVGGTAIGTRFGRTALVVVVCVTVTVAAGPACVMIKLGAMLIPACLSAQLQLPSGEAVLAKGKRPVGRLL